MTLLEREADNVNAEDASRDLDKKRMKIQLAGIYDPLIAFGGSLIMYLTRVKLEIPPESYSALQENALKTLVLSLVDFKRANGRDTRKIINKMTAMISDIADIKQGY